MRIFHSNPWRKWLLPDELSLRTFIGNILIIRVLNYGWQLRKLTHHFLSNILNNFLCNIFMAYYGLILKYRLIIWIGQNIIKWNTWNNLRLTWYSIYHLLQFLLWNTFYVISWAQEFLFGFENYFVVCRQWFEEGARFWKILIHEILEPSLIFW